MTSIESVAFRRHSGRPGTEQVAASGYHFLTDLEVQAIPAAHWLVEDLLLEDSIAIVAGPGESGKTLLVLGLSLCIATGIRWHGHAVKAGLVAYISGEGHRGLGRRIRAWKQCYEVPIETQTSIHLLLEAVPLMDPDRLRDLLTALHGLPEPPVLVVIDTLSQCTLGADENTAEMAMAIAAAAQIRREFACTVVILHHTTKDGKSLRGHSSLRDNVDTVLFLVRDDRSNTVTVTCDKQRDGEHFSPIVLSITQVHLPVQGDEQRGEREEFSAVLSPSHVQSAPAVANGKTIDAGPPRRRVARRVPALAENCKKAIAALAAAPSGLTATEWEFSSGLPETAFKAARKALVENRQVEGGGRRGARYTLVSLEKQGLEKAG